METYQVNGLWIAKINNRISGGHSDKNDAVYAVLAAEIQGLGSLTGDEFIPPDLNTIRVWALSVLNQLRGDQREAIGLTEARWQDLAYTGKALEAQRWQSAPETQFGYAREAAARGISDAQMAALILGQWAAMQEASDAIEAAYVVAKAAIETAQTVEEIEMVLAELQDTQ